MLDFIKQDKDPETGKVMRKVRSFVLREGRLLEARIHVRRPGRQRLKKMVDWFEFAPFCALGGRSDF